VQHPALQAVYYHPGVGTMEPPGALTDWEKKKAIVRGLALGAGLERDIADAYAFLINQFKSRDRIFLFGFSRGAYTARAVASLVSMYGLLPAGNEAFVPYAVRMLSGVNSAHPSVRDRAFKLASEFRETFDPGRRCGLHFVGVWDTVSSVGWIENPLALGMAAQPAARSATRLPSVLFRPSSAASSRGLRKVQPLPIVDHAKRSINRGAGNQARRLKRSGGDYS
jgi:uncharacterized protein (DUF2235 family)